MAASNPNLAPRLVVSAGEGQAALDFYAAAFAVEAQDLMWIDGKLANGHIPIGDTLMGLTEGDGQVSMSPTQVGGSPVLLSVTFDEVDPVAARFAELGAEFIFELNDQPYGRRDCRMRDPFGHLWILGHEL